MIVTHSDAVSMAAEDFLHLRDLVHTYCGICLVDSLKFAVERRLQARLEAVGVASFADYCRLLKNGRASHRELEEIVDLITTNETYFFREIQQLECCVFEIVPELLRARADTLPLRVWSAGCSSGEEPFSIAMLLKELPTPLPADVDIFGSDISRKAVRQARLGLYRDLALRQTSAARRQRFFIAQPDAWLLHEEIRRQVRFAQLNLLNEASTRAIGGVDIVLCRNVMFYFSKEARRRLLDSFYRKMRPGGYLLLGHAESLLHCASPFEIVTCRHGIVYRKPQHAQHVVIDGRPAPGCRC